MPTAPTQIYTLSLHDALPIYARSIYSGTACDCRDVVPSNSQAMLVGSCCVVTRTAVFWEVANPYSIGTCRGVRIRSEEHTSELQSQSNLVCRLLLEKKKNFKK